MKAKFFKHCKDYTNLKERTEEAIAKGYIGSESNYVVNKIVNLNEKDFEEFKSNFMATQLYIVENVEYMKHQENDTLGCLEITCDCDASEAFLVFSWGFYYPRFIAIEEVI